LHHVSSGKVMIEKYFAGLSDSFESVIQRARTLPEIAQAGLSPDMPEDDYTELKVAESERERKREGEGERGRG
jgi:hypothetical protein